MRGQKIRKPKGKNMRLVIFILFLTFSVPSLGQSEQKLKGKPTTLEETYIHLDQIFDDTTKYGFMTLPEDVATGRLHFGFGMWMRNNWGLWRNSELKRYFLDRGVGHPDDMSGIILVSYHRHLNNKPVDLEGQITRIQNLYNGIVREGNKIIYPEEYMIKRTSDSILMELFQINDTIFVTVYASFRKFFSTYASSVRATAIVREHRGGKLFVEIIEMENKRKYKPERKVGDIFETYPDYCSLIPPRGWRFEKTKNE